MNKEQIVKEWERITFTKMDGLHRPVEELQKILDFQKKATTEGFDYWFNRDENSDLRMPIKCSLSFKNRLTNDEWVELTKYIFRKCRESQDWVTKLGLDGVYYIKAGDRKEAKSIHKELQLIHGKKPLMIVGTCPIEEIKLEELKRLIKSLEGSK